MKKYLVGTEDNEKYTYDINDDGKVNIVDLIILMNIFLEA